MTAATAATPGHRECGPPPRYRGRFAPSPTGPLHFGSLVAAVGSYLDARHHGGEWLLRVEDVDTPRCVPGAAEGIVRTLESYGLVWDGEIAYQSRRHEAYIAALQRLRAAGRVFGCACSRREIADSGLPTADGTPRYPGTCRAGLPLGRSPRAYRLRVEPGTIYFDDRVQGRIGQDLAQEVGDFIVFRADGLFAYQLAVVVDDVLQGVTDVVRGADLLESTPRQIYLQRLLGAPAPRYLHLPVAVDARGEKLSKQTLARAVDDLPRGPTLAAALAFLGMTPPRELAGASPPELWRWAIEAWRPERVPRSRCAPAPPALSLE